MNRIKKLYLTLPTVFRKCFENSVTEFSFQSNLNCNLLNRILGSVNFIFSLVISCSSHFYISYFSGAFVFFVLLIINILCTKFSFHVSLNFAHSSS